MINNTTGFNFVGFDPSDPQYSDDCQTFLDMFTLLGLDDLFTYDFSIDVYWLDVRSVVKNNGAYFKALSQLAYYNGINDEKATGTYALSNASQIISELTVSASGHTFAKFINNVKDLNKKIAHIIQKIEKEKEEKGTKVRYDYFTLVKYYDGD